MHHYVEVLDKYFNSVCELDLIFNFHKAYYILDEIMLAGHIQESSKKLVLKAVTNQEALIDDCLEEKGNKK
jgi:AP-1 complex subunit sigma 1/2